MRKRTRTQPHVIGLLTVIVGAFAAQQGCADDETATTPTGCTAPETSCDGVCVDTATTGDHCGACNNACDTGQDCVGGQCQCAGGTTPCGGVCVNANTDISNCGSCGITCAEFEECASGDCQCPEGMATCSSGCADITSDKLNCGQCNISCMAAQSCVNSDCVCPDNKELCFSECVDTTSDSNYCGDCTTACDPGEHCNASTCEAISDCGDVDMDQYEENDTCASASTLPEAAEGAPTAVTVSDATLHHTDESLDTDWYAILATEGQHTCVPFTGQCYFVFDIAFTPPDVAAYETYQLCILAETCGATEICTETSDWDAQAGRYDLAVSWEGTCGASDNTQLYVKIARDGGEESCEQYSLEYQMSYTDEGC
jgi:hypothetical protein